MTEILSVPEEYLLEVIKIIRAGLKTNPNCNKEVKQQLTKWCKDEEDYIKNC